METELSAKQIQKLENSYLALFPEEIPESYFFEYKSVLRYKSLLKNVKPNRLIFDFLLEITLEKINTNKPFQRLTLITLLYHHCEKLHVDSKVSENIFIIFKSLIYNNNILIGSKANALLKDIKLSDENIQWLIDNYETSIHIQNRLIRYPESKQAITKWAEKMLKIGELEDRRSELIGLLLNNNFDLKDLIRFSTIEERTNKLNLVWGIHFSKLNDDIKKELLLMHLSVDNFDEVLKICERNQYTDLISQFYESYIVKFN